MSVVGETLIVLALVAVSAARLVIHAWGRSHLEARREVYCGPSRDEAATMATEIAMAAGWGQP